MATKAANFIENRLKKAKRAEKESSLRKTHPLLHGLVYGVPIGLAMWLVIGLILWRIV